MAAGTRRINMGVLFTTRKSPSIHSVSVRRSRSKAIAFRHAELFLSVIVAPHERRHIFSFASEKCLSKQPYCLLGFGLFRPHSDRPSIVHYFIDYNRSKSATYKFGKLNSELLDANIRYKPL